MEARNNVRNKVKPFVVRSVLLSGQLRVCRLYVAIAIKLASVIEASPVKLRANLPPFQFRIETGS